MSSIKRIITLTAISAATVAFAPAVAGAAPIGPGAGSGSTASADLATAQHASASTSAPLDRFGLAHLHDIAQTTGSELTGSDHPERFQFDDAAIGGGAMAGLMLLGTAGALTVRRRAHLRHP